MGALKHRLLAAFLAVAATTAASLADTPGASRLDPDAVIERSEATLGRLVGNHVLIDTKGDPLSLDAYRGRPLVISLVYTSCSSVCPVTTQHLIEAVADAREVVGDGFSVLTVGFDARHDTPAQLAAFASAQGIDDDDWRLASADETTIRELLNDLGFTYEATAGSYQHITQTTILDADGRIYRHVYGDNFPVQIFIEPLKELVFGLTIQSFSLDNVVDRVRFICTTYNPSTGAYEFDYANFVGIAVGGTSLLIVGFIIFKLWRNNRQLMDKQEERG